MIEPIWAKRNIYLKEFLSFDNTVVDFGCGDKSILNYYTFKEYIGLDKNNNADVIIDLNTAFTLPKVYDIGLVLGVLEYLDNPRNFLKNIQAYANTFIILIMPRNKPKKGWKQSFTKDHFSDLLKDIFTNVKFAHAGKYFIANCN